MTAPAAPEAGDLTAGAAPGLPCASGAVDGAARRLIDHWFPCAAVDDAVGTTAGSGRSEKALFTWFASRPIAQARAAVLTALLPDEDGLRPDLDRAIRGDRDAHRRLAEVIAGRYPDGPPVVLDMFSGRGIIPLEAARMGATAVGVDLSPVATLGGRLLADYPFRDWSAEPPLPFEEANTSPVQTSLASDSTPRLLNDVRLVLDEIGRRLEDAAAPYYPRNPDGRFPWAYLWAVTIPCDRCKRRFPLVGSLVLRHPYQRTHDAGQALRLIVRGDVWHTEVVDGAPDQQATFDAPSGRKGKSAVCLFCSHVHTLDAVKAKGISGEYSDALLAVADGGDTPRKTFRVPRPDEIEAASRVGLDALPPFGQLSAVPNELIPAGNEDTVRASGYEYRAYGDIMNDRQAFQFAVNVNAIRTVHRDLLDTGLSVDYAKVLACYAVAVPHWADVLTLRPEVMRTDGSVGELQMSLHKAVYQTVDVPYRRVGYYADITQPTPHLVGFLGRVARRLGTATDATALFHLDQGMGGGKSHALVGLYHMAAHPEEFFATDLGRKVHAEAEAGGASVDLTGTRVVTLCADEFSPGKPTENFGPATTLFERFLWGLTKGNRTRYDRYVAMGVNKHTLRTALDDAGGPVLILLDELMDYAQNLTDKTAIDTLPGEQAFLNALTDACDDVPWVAFIVVMIKSDLDERGYHFKAEEFREYITQRLVRNGTTVPVTEAQDFAAIIRRRLFETTEQPVPAAALASAYEAVDRRWREKVLDRLGAARRVDGRPGRIAASYPFAPDLMRLVQEEWSQVTGFQRVRSTVAIFARTALHWVNEHEAGRWAPTLIGVGDIPLTAAVEQVLSSGLLLGNARSIQGYRAVAGTDITSVEGSAGRAVTIDQHLREAGIDAGQPQPAVRMATALFCYSLVARPQGRRGATKPELLAAVLEPPVSGPGTLFTAAEEAFNRLTAEDGLGALEITNPGTPSARFWLSIKQTLRMYHNAAQQLVQPWERDELIWKTARDIATKGSFDRVALVDAPKNPDHELVRQPLEETFRKVDAEETRLVVLDPARWTLLNGRDDATRADLTAMFGLGPAPLRVDNAASCVVACANAYKRDHARKRAAIVLAWQRVLPQLSPDDADEIREARATLREEENKLREAVAAAYQHYEYLIRSGDTFVVDRRRFDDKRSSLSGEDVWDGLVRNSRATAPDGMSEAYVATLLDRFDRQLTLREVRQAFYKNADFPLVPSLDEIRRALFKLLSLGWEIVDAYGMRAGITTAEQIPVNSMNQVIQRVHVDPEPPEPPQPLPPQPVDTTTPGHGAKTALKTDPRDRVTPPIGPTPKPPPVTPGKTTYKRYHARLENTSITNPDVRNRVWKLLGELARLVDPAKEGFDHQLINIDLILTTAEGHIADVEQRVKEAGGEPVRRRRRLLTILTARRLTCGSDVPSTRPPVAL